MSCINIALLGFGTVGKGVYQSIDSHQSRLQQLLGKPVKVVAILVKNINKHITPKDGVLLTNNFQDIADLPDLHIVIDAIVGKEPGFSYLSKAIEKGCHIITANKEMFASYGAELLSAAKDNGVSVGFEATVAGGVPIIQTIQQVLQVNRIKKVDAILNGTSNFILTSMRKDGRTFEETLGLAQEKGYAEADPTNDIEGYDAYYKALILSQLIYGKQPNPDRINRQGITRVSPSHISIAETLGLRFRHLVSLYKEKDEIVCKVEPALVSSEHPFYQVDGVQNGISIDTDLVGNVQLQGPGAGMFPTASAILEDIIHLGRSPIAPPSSEEHITTGENVARWIVFGESLTVTPLFTNIKIVDRIHDKAIIIESKDITVTSDSEIAIFPLKGEYHPKKESIAI